MLSDRKKLSLMLVAVEPSGDALGADLIKSLREQYDDELSLCGCGGPLMMAAGFESAFSIEPLSVMGFTDVAKALPEAYARTGELASLCKRKNIDGVIFIDGWAFSRLGAQKIKSISPETKLFKYVAPQVWASRPQRIKFVKKYFDGVLTLLPFEEKIFSSEGVQSCFVGNSVFQHAWQQRSKDCGDLFRERHGVGDDPLLAVLPGSRFHEIKRLSAPFIETIGLLREKISNLKIVLPLAPSVQQEASEIFSSVEDIIFVGSEEKYEAFSGANAALAASGTVTTELALYQIPMVLAYKLDRLTAIWVRRVINIEQASILSIMAGRELIPEFLQENCKPELMAKSLHLLLTDTKTRDAQLKGLEPILAELHLDGPPASTVAAQTLLGWLGFSRAQSN